MGQRTHEQQKKSKARIESRLRQPQRIAWIAHSRRHFSRIRHVRSVSIEPGHKRAAERAPESAEGAENDEGEGVADDPFTNGTENHEDRTEEEEYTCAGC